jgi:hypothetical protein
MFLKLTIMAFLLFCLFSFNGLVGSVETQNPTSPSIFNTEHWVPLQYVSGPSKPMPPVSESWKDNGAEIFVGLVHYRDRRCSDTLMNLFGKAKYPDRIHVGT